MNSPRLILTKTTADDLNTLFEFQRDPKGIFLAAFTPGNPDDKAGYLSRYGNFLKDPSIIMMTIWLDEKIVGSISRYVMEGDHEITYWIDTAHWGKGIATTALKMFLEIDTIRPIHGRVVIDNFGSQKVLEYNGFVRIGKDSGFANGRQTEVEEYIYKLEL